MKFKGTKLSKRTAALLAAALVMMGSGGAVGTRAALNVESDDRLADFGTDAISVVLTENGSDLADDAELFSSLGDTVEPGMTYEDTVGVKNDGAADEYVRVIVRKSWKAADADAKDTTLAPKTIQLTLADNWYETAGLSDEETIYYYTPGELASGETADLFTALRIDNKVLSQADGVEVTTKQEGADNVTITTYKYKYNGYSFTVEAEVQAVQTHNAEDAIKSIWGVDAADTHINF